LVAQQSRKLPHRKGTGVRISYPPPKFTSGCSWESSLIPNQAHGVRILIPVPRRARQMVSQHVAKVPSARARLGSIPRLSAKVFSLGVRRIRLAAPACRAECSIGASRFESGDTHHDGPVVQLAEATGSKSVESGFESQRGHQRTKKVEPTHAHRRAITNAPGRPRMKSATTRFQTGSGISSDGRRRSCSPCVRERR
jgi:hypothetical protein